MSIVLPASLSATQPPQPAIAPHLLHSPVQSPSIDLQNFMDSYRDPGAPDSPHSLGCYSASPPSRSDANHADTPAPEPIISPRRMLTIYSYGPAAAPAGSPLTAQVDFRNLSGTSVRLRIVFGDLALPTSVIPNGPPAHHQVNIPQEQGDWKLRIFVPPYGQASPHMALAREDGRREWPLTLQALDSNGNLLDTVGFGLFMYEDLPPSQTGSHSSPAYEYETGSRSPNKRSRDEDDDEYSPLTPTKRLALDTEAMDLRRMSVTSADSSLSITQHGLTPNRALVDESSPAPSQTLPPGMAIPPRAFQHQPPLHGAGPSQHMPPESFAVKPSVEEYTDDGPALVRTSQLVFGRENSEGTKASQASVSLEGDLEVLKKDWTEGEYAAGRRLIQFWKRQVGTTLHVSFSAIAQHQYTDNTIVISCIYRDSNEEYFVTSVDVIYLLEALAGVRFEVEEKNRIRRNLEGFKPMTVSKSKSGTEDFFKTIMEFPPPRPRNIEKDVKVFEWGKLKCMLEKVFSKYSTVPIPQNTTSPRYDVPAHGPSGMLYTFPKAGSIPAAEQHRLSIRHPGGHKSQKRRSPGPKARLHNEPVLAPFPVPSQAIQAYPDTLLQAKYDDVVDYDAGLDHREYGYDGMRYLNIPAVDPGLLKVDTAFGNGNGNNVAVGLDKHQILDSFRPTSPVSSDNSPSSMSLSLSSGPSSDGEHAENQSMARTSTGDSERSTSVRCV